MPALGQNNSSEGKSFYLSIIPNLITNIDCELTLSSSTNTVVKLSNISKGYSKTVTLIANTPQAVVVPKEVCIPSKYDTVTRSLIYITADDPITVYAMNAAPASADGALVYPEDSYGSKYYVASYENLSKKSDGGSNFIIIATKDNTHIKIVPSSLTKGLHPKGVEYTIVLNKGETYMESGFEERDLSGTYIEVLNNKKIAVYGGTKCVNIPKGCGACDVLMEQMIPISRLGREYLLAPLSTTTKEPKYTYRIISTKDNNKVTVNGSLLTTLSKGEVYNEHNVVIPLCVKAEKPVMVIQYAQGKRCTGVGDPAMVIIPPVEQFIKKVNYATPNYIRFLEHHIYILTKKGSSITLNGAKIDKGLFKAFSFCSEYEYVSININKGKYLVESPEGFSFIAYGYGNHISYAYIGGASFRNIQYGTAIKEPICGALDYEFKNTGDTGKIVSSMWLFGDGTSDTGLLVNKVYKKHGIYTVKNIIKVKDEDFFLTDTLENIVTTKPLPNPNFSINNSQQCIKGNQFQFADTSGIVLGTVKPSNWYIDNNVVSGEQQNLGYKFLNAGEHIIKLIAVSDKDCKDSIEKTVMVHPDIAISVNINDSIQCFNSHEFILTNNSTVNGSGSINKYNWQFSDGSKSSSQSPQPKEFLIETDYSVKCIMQTDKGCLDTFEANLGFYDRVLPNFEANNVCLKDSVAFNNITPDTEIMQWQWHFGDGKISTQKKPNHTYNKAGDYTVRLAALTNDGCWDTAIRDFVNLVYPLPIVDFDNEFVRSDKNQTIHKFTNYSVGGINYLWNFGDSSISNSVNPEKTYLQAGYFFVSLTVENQWNCKVRLEKRVLIVPENDINIPNAFTPGNGDNLNTHFGMEGIYFAKEMDMKIFNRWGELIFQSNKLENTWDGTYKQEYVPDGVYLYTFRIVDHNNELHIYNGSVTVIK